MRFVRGGLPNSPIAGNALFPLKLVFLRRRAMGGPTILARPLKTRVPTEA